MPEVLTPNIESPKGLMSLGPLAETLSFQWNVEGFATNLISFTYYIGEGPLYWYRIEWTPGPCTNIAVDIPPEIIYERGYPSCPTEIEDICETLPPCYCPPCQPGQCVDTTVEIWHMLATSVTHLCYRINNECCNRKPSGQMSRVQQYLRPALCCDVVNANWAGFPSSIDGWVDVDFIDVCECGNLVNTCLAQVVYPAHINNCGIGGPVYSGPPLPNPPAGGLGTFTSFAPEIPIKQLAINKVGKVSEVVSCDFNNTCVNLYYDKQRKLWHGTQHLKDSRIVFELELTNSGYKFGFNAEKQNKKTKIFIVVKGVEFNKQLDIDFNTKSGTINKGTLQSKIVNDGIGMFRMSDLKIKLKG